MLSQDPASTFFRPKTMPVKRRNSERHRCKVRLIGQLVLPQTGETLDVWVRDLSEKGLGFIVSKNLELGTQGIFKVKKNAAVSGLHLALKVVHCNMESECCWHVGCEFSEPLPAPLLDYFVR